MVPLVPASGKRDAFRSGTLRFDGCVPVSDGSVGLKEKLTEIYSQTGPDDSIALLDVDGFRSEFLNSEIVKEVRIKGRDLWLITYISNIDDVFSALAGAFAGVGIPLHTIGDEDVLLEASDISESVFPAAFMKDGREISSNKDRDGIIQRMKELRFGSVLFIDIDPPEAEYVQIEPAVFDTI